jgi:outer membrane receptor protein involved in Fe transport
MRNFLIKIIVVAAMAMLGATVQAQQSGGGIHGSVVGDSSGVQVQVTSTDHGVSQSRSIGSDGSFRFDGLAPGNYEVSVIKDGTTVDSAPVTVSLAGVTSLSMATTQSAVEEIIVTGGRIRAFDTSIAEQGLVITAGELLLLPVSRDLAAVALLAPGASKGDSRFGSSGNISFGGASIAENTSFINGLNTTNFRTGVGFSQVPFEFYDTIQVKTGGYSAKYGRSLGGVMNAKTKRGTNEWSGGINIYMEENISESPDTYAAANHLDEKDVTTADVYVSGPLIKDRLFFYALYSDQEENQRYAGITSGRDYDFLVDQGFTGVKLDGYITDNHKLEYTYFSDDRTEVESVYGFDPETNTRGTYLGDTFYGKGGDNWIATYTGDITDNFQVSLSYGENEANRTEAPASADIPVVYLYDDGFNAVGDWTNFTVSKGSDRREMTRLDLRWTLDNHEISFGIDNEDNFADESTVNSGGVYWLLDPSNTFRGCTPAECPQGANARKRTYQVGGSFETNSEALYIQDTWTMNDHWTFEVGVRNESFVNLNGAGGVFVEVEDQLAPRLSAVFDPSGEGTSKFYANYGLYYLPIAANTNIRMSGNETYIQEYYDWNGTSLDSQFVPQGLGSVYITDVFGDGTVPDTRSTTDANIDAMYQSEIILGFEKILDNGYEFGVKGTYRNLETTIEDVAIDAAVISHYNSTGSWNPGLVDGASVEDVFGGFHQYVLTNPGNDMRVFIPEQDEFVDLTAAQLNYPEAKREYKSVEFNLTRPFDGRWGGNVSYLWSESTGNHEGYVKSDNGQDDAGITTNFDQPGLVDFSEGDLPNDRTHTIKLTGTYALDNGLRFGTNVIWQTGRPRSCFGVHPTDGFAAAYQAASHFCGGTGVQRGSLGTTKSNLNIDLNTQYEMNIMDKPLILSLDIFNVLDADAVTRFNEDGDTGGGEPNPNYALPLSYQAPRSVRLSARIKF